jgi:CheY-like chemotaxis protein
MRRARPERSKAVLVVDDDRDVRETLAEAVQTTGRLAFIAAGGAEALHRLDDPDLPRPCLIILDWKMFPMNGGEFLERLALRQDSAEFPVLVVTGDSALHERAVPGVLATLQKPDLEGLLRLLDEYA